MNDQETRQLWDDQRSIAAKETALTSKERAVLSDINRKLRSDSIDMTAEGVGIDTTNLVGVLQNILTHHINMYKLNRNTNPMKGEDYLVKMYYAAHVFAIEVSTSVAGEGTERFSNFSGNALLDIGEFVRTELGIDDLDNDPRFSFIRGRK